MFTQNKNFYPTPKELAYEILHKINIQKEMYILEPSAGKGNLINSFKKFFINKTCIVEDRINEFIKIDSIEKDINLNNLLRGKGENVIWDDFLTFEAPRFYDLIFMNPPFDNGAKHLLKAIQIQERIGGQILCILNAETLKNAYSNDRRYLIQLLKKYNADIEYKQNAFQNSERKSNVSIAIVYINVPMKDKETIFEKEFKKDNPKIDFKEINTLMPKMNKLQQLIFECDLIKKSVIKLYEEKIKIDKLLGGFNLGSNLDICHKSGNHPYKISLNKYIEEINLNYWHKFIDETDLKNRVPSKLRDHFIYGIEKRKNIAFIMENVKYFYDEIINTIPKSYEETVANVFDLLTVKYHYSETTWNKTIHYYNGWKTNKAYKINNKVIIIDEKNGGEVPKLLLDLNIIFENLAGKKDIEIKENKYNKDHTTIKERIEYCEKNIETEFFMLDSYKKGTLHIKFKDKKLLQKFNLLASKGKHWLPPSFGKKSYQDMTKEEQQVIKNFGLVENEYNNLVLQKNNQDYLRLSERNN